jgi:Gluconate 2-dehydrogenase subunit 3
MDTSTDMQSRPLTRREVIRRVSALLGGVAFVGGNGLLAAIEKHSIAPASVPGKFTAQNIVLLDEIAETILPATKTPGAKAAKTGAFIALMVTDCYSPADQKVFFEGMQKVNEAALKANQVSFMDATPAQRLAVLSVLDHEQKSVMDAREAADRKRKGLAPLPGSGAVAPEADIQLPHHYFRMMKELTLLGFFTSEIGCTQVLRYVETPGRFDPCIPFTAGQPAWAAHA